MTTFPKRLNRVKLLAMIREAHYAKPHQVDIRRNQKRPTEHVVTIRAPNSKVVVVRGNSFLQVALNDAPLRLRLHAMAFRLADGRRRHLMLYGSKAA